MHSRWRAGTVSGISATSATIKSFSSWWLGWPFLLWWCGRFSGGTGAGFKIAFAATTGLQATASVQTKYHPAQQQCGNLFLQHVSLPVRQLDTEPGPRRLLGMTTLANALALLG